MFGLNSEPNFADCLSYVNNFLLYFSRFSVPLVVFVFYNLNIVKITKYQMIVLFVIQHIPTFVSIAPKSANSPDFGYQILIISKANSNLIISSVMYFSELYHTMKSVDERVYKWMLNQNISNIQNYYGKLMCFTLTFYTPRLKIVKRKGNNPFGLFPFLSTVNCKYLNRKYYLLCLIFACAAAKRAIGTR